MIARTILMTIVIFAGVLAGCGETAPKIPDRKIVTNKYLGAPVAEHPNGDLFARFEYTTSTDGRLKKLQPIKELTELRLSGTDATDVGLRYIQKLRQIKLIDVKDSPGITDEGLKILPAGPQLIELTLIGTSVTDAGTATLKRFPGLERLSIGGLNDEGLKSIVELKRLKRLALLHCRITDRGVGYLAQAKKPRAEKLQFLTLVECDITDPVYVRLKAAMPHCKIQRR